jgi:hypothetical protein
MDRPVRWRYVLPSIHLLACVSGYVGLLLPRLQFFGILFSFVLLVDLPVSLLAYGLGWKHPVLALTWVFVAGTLWWYLLGRAVQAVFLWFAHRNDTPAKLTG